MLNIKQFRKHIIVPALHAIDLYSEAAEELLLGTALQESRLEYLVQLGTGPAKGVFQMEPATHDDIWANYLRYQPELAAFLRGLSIQTRADQMVGNLWYAAAMCRVHYRRVRAALPAAGDAPGMAQYWKRYYNTHLGAGTVEEYLENWNRYAS